MVASNQLPTISNQLLASIIIVNWNGAAHLPVCLNALRAQTFRNFEVIVADNASHDESLHYSHAIIPK